MKILLATSNDHKIKEFNEMAAGYDLEFVSLKTINFDKEIIEDGTTFEENALIKARAVASVTDMPVMADDSGIIIEALGDNFPGVYSHRYQIQNGGNYETNKMLASKIPGSKAYFTCCLVLLNVEKEPLIFKGIYNGTISSVVTNEAGFGYDPIFIPDGYNVTVDQLSEEEKNKISHRSRAFEKLIEYLKTRL